MADWKDSACCEEISVTRILLEENGIKAVFVNPNKEAYLKLKVDACYIVPGPACDWLISKKNATGAVFIELKGSDVKRAAEQIAASADKLREELPGKIAGLIIANRFPKIDTSIQRAISAFAKKHKAPLHVMTGNHEYVFEKVFEFAQLKRNSRA